MELFITYVNRNHNRDPLMPELKKITQNWNSLGRQDAYSAEKQHHKCNQRQLPKCSILIHHQSPPFYRTLSHAFNVSSGSISGLKINNPSLLAALSKR